MGSISDEKKYYFKIYGAPFWVGIWLRDAIKNWR
jgi:hypothetical protein